MKYACLPLLVLLCLITACPSEYNRPALAARPPLDTLRQHFWESRQLTIIYPSCLESVVKPLRNADNSWQLRLKTTEAAEADDAKDGSVFLLGNIHNNPWLEAIAPQPALFWQSGQLHLNNEPVADSAVAFLSFYPNPESPHTPLFIGASNDTAALAAVLRHRLQNGFSLLGWGGWQYELYQNGRRSLAGQYHPQSWAVDPDRRFVTDGQTTVKDTASVYRFHFHGEPEDQEDYVRISQACTRQARQLLEFCGQQWRQPKIDLHLYPSLEAKGLALQNTQPVQVQWEERSASIVASPYFRTHSLGEQNELLLQQVLGNPGHAFLAEGLGVIFNDKWQGRGHRYWAAHVARPGNWPPLSTLFGKQWQQINSSLLKTLAAATFCDFIIAHWGRHQFLEQYRTWRPTPQQLEALEPHWAAFLRQLASTSPQRPDRRATTPGYWKGFNFAHEGYAIYNGYGSELAAQMLREQHQLGANAVTLVPYSYMREPDRPTPLPFMTRAGTETDESIIRDLQYAQELGMKVMLKPQIWLGGGHWPGDIAMETEADWAAFFQYYQAWIQHYALLAEIEGADAFCVGVEFTQATLKKPGQWRALIEKIRGLYKGSIVYAANWGEEFEQLQFWDALDWIGLNCYYPLSQQDAPSTQTLAGSFRDKLEKARAISRRYQRPLLITEIGFTSTTAPWITPYKDGEGAAYSGAAQLKCYEMATQVLSQAGDWCRGVLWWKYPSYPTLGGQGHTGFTPNNKPAEQQLPLLFRQLPSD